MRLIISAMMCLSCATSGPRMRVEQGGPHQAAHRTQKLVDVMPRSGSSVMPQHTQSIRDFGEEHLLRALARLLVAISATAGWQVLDIGRSTRVVPWPVAQTVGETSNRAAASTFLRSVPSLSGSAELLSCQELPIGEELTVNICSGMKCFQRDKEVTGKSLWAASAIVLEWFRRPEHQELFKSRSVLELGAGTGYLGISLAKMGAHVVMTDLELQLDLLSRNIELNAPYANDGNVSSAALAWGSKPPASWMSKFGLIVAADVAYQDDLLKPLAETTAALLLGDGTLDTSPVGVFALTRHRAFTNVPDHAHIFIHDLLVGHYGLHAAMVDCIDDPQSVVGKDYFQGAAFQEGHMPIHIFVVGRNRTVIDRLQELSF